MGFKNLPNIHTARYAQGVQYDLDRFAIRQERHIFARQDAGNNTFVPVTACHLIAFADFTFLNDADTNLLIDARRQFIAVFTGKDLDGNNDPEFPMRNTEGAVTDFPCLFSKDGTDEALFSRKFRFPFRRDFADEDISRTDFSTDTNDSVFVEVLQGIFRNVRDIAGNLFRSQFRIAGIAVIFFNMDGGKDIFLDEVFAEEDGVFVVVASQGI